MRRKVRYRITLGGALFAVALSFTGFAAFLSANNLLFLVFSALLALLLVSGFLSRLVLAGLEVELLLPRHVSAGAVTPAVIRVRNLKAHTPSFSIELAGRKDPLSGLPSILKPVIYFPVIPAGGVMEASVQVSFPRRGRHRIDHGFHVHAQAIAVDKAFVRQRHGDLVHHDRGLRLDQPREWRRQRDIAHACAGSAQTACCVFEGGHGFGLRPVPFAGPAQAYARSSGKQRFDHELSSAGQRRPGRVARNRR